MKVRLKNASLHFYCSGGSILFGTEGASGLAINCYDTARAGNLELKVCIMWHRVESSKRGSSEQCMIVAAKGGDVED